MMPEHDNPSPTTMTDLPAPRAKRQGPWLFVAIAALALAGWQWFETRQKLVDTQQEVSRRLAEFDTANKEEHGAQKQTREQIEALQAKLGAVEGRFSEFQAQTEALKALNQDIARGREEATLLEVEQAITLAGQQLQLAGNVPVAVLALQTADSRLARLDRPQYLPLRKAVAKDLQKLNALPFVDMPGISLRLEQVILGIDKLPLASYGRPVDKSESQKVADVMPWWQRTGGDIWQELKGLVRIQRFDREETALLAPGQGYFLRENLKLRLLNARLALFSRDQWTFRNELKVSQDWLARHFDANDKSVLAAQSTLRQMTATEINVELPNLNETQAALRALRPSKEKR
ncbi:uroporphyrinogen-III C-methyltransferase [Ferribacterium limneticum]|uniref:uroporphyrinogen-III C-methyltransferase n=1 Tax=Ferribacterium limneticum TaxID=76259 RepID=UPI001CFB5761|nr:uroporphyrinogen-III C-methyltransferase [Ferribacterium limneticum]UCV27980.1 uroporphyrinogen-III C-methyltransferase [Ferribacterium limneticum]UCV31897.1 uroporphyrinogen-III C-methyltransferase [Ferribacterium limneticum]